MIGEPMYFQKTPSFAIVCSGVCIGNRSALSKLIGIIALCFMASSCSQAQPKTASRNVLIVYLSRTNNTKAVAELIQQQTGGTLMALELETPYPADYQTTVQQVARENETGYLPPLKTRIDTISNYDVVFVGFPTWGMQLPPPMKSFLHQYDLSGKTVAPFNTNAGYGVGSSFDTVRKLCQTSTVVEGLSMKGGIERDGVLLVMEGEKAKRAELEVTAWLQEIRLLPHRK